MEQLCAGGGGVGQGHKVRKLFVTGRTVRPGETTAQRSLSVPASGLQHLEATATQLVLANRPMEVASVLSPTRPLSESDLTVPDRGFPRIDGGRPKREAPGLEF
jgi:hypothetical protein